MFISEVVLEIQKMQLSVWIVRWSKKNNSINKVKTVSLTHFQQSMYFFNLNLLSKWFYLSWNTSVENWTHFWCLCSHYQFLSQKMSLCSKYNKNFDLLNINFSCDHARSCRNDNCQFAYYEKFSSWYERTEKISRLSSCYKCHQDVKEFIYISVTLLFVRNELKFKTRVFQIIRVIL